MKDSFLYKQIKTIFDRFPDEIDQISIIIPNRRAAVYIQKYLSEVIGKTFFSPEILTINEWIDQHTPEKILSKTELLFILHEIHQEIEKENPESFEKFMLWGRTILSDFDEIDKYLVEPTEVFKNLKDIKELESWDISEEEMGEAQAKFNAIWDQLSDYYLKLELKLKAIGATYSGRAYKTFYEKLDTIKLSKHTYFLGFNAISRVEKAIMKKLIDEEKGTAIFEIDQFYFNNDQHEAAYFYRDLIKEWKVKPALINSIDQHPKRFEIIETSQQVGQAKIAGSYVRQLVQSGEESKDTAVILADESLLIPLTKSLPADIDTANITMGWPIKFSHLKAFLDIIFEFQFNFDKFKSDLLYHKTLIKFLQHPYVQELVADEKIGDTIKEELSKSNRIFVEKEFVISKAPVIERLEFLFTVWDEDNLKRLYNLELMIQNLYETFREDEKRRIDLEIIYQFSIGVKKLSEILKDRNVELSIRSFKLLFYQFWQSQSLSFYGNPIDGLQVMGILETRTLDFKNLIIIGMNEGNLPKTDPFNSFIPRDLRFYLGLPTEEDRQAVFAHHFYRLLHRSQNVIMTYNSSGESIGNSEKSRYITQLENEIDRSIHSWENKTFGSKDEKADTKEVVYKSTPEVHKRLDEILARGLSPSALNKLVNCPLDFYYRYVLKFDESDDVEENIESSTFGTKIHTVLQKIIEDNFKEGENFKPLNIALLEKEKKEDKIRERLLEAYMTDDGGKKFSKNDLKYGQNKLSFDISVQFIKTFLEQQIKELKKGSPVLPIELEKDIEAEFQINIAGKEKTVKFFGKADRIDQIGSQYRILDYKSGKSDDKTLKVPDVISEEKFKDTLKRGNSSHVRQLLMYGSMFRQTFKDKRPFSAGIISMIKISDWIHYLTHQQDVVLSEESIDHFEKVVLDKIIEMYDPDFEFKHEPDSEYCQHCER